MAEARYLSILDAEALHVFVMRRLGARPSTLRDHGALESALTRPRMAAHYAGADLVQQCALLAVGISQAQAFVDGNKRTAFIAADVSLRLNGYRFSGDPLDMARQLEGVAERKDSISEATARFADWLGAHVDET